MQGLWNAHTFKIKVLNVCLKEKKKIQQNALNVLQEFSMQSSPRTNKLPDMDLIGVSEMYANFSPLTATLVITMDLCSLWLKLALYHFTKNIRLCEGT